MDNITLIVGAILSIIGATGALVRWLTPKGRLRADVMSGLELLKAEPPSSAKPELEQHITYQTRLLIAFEEPF